MRLFSSKKKATKRRAITGKTVKDSLISQALFEIAPSSYQRQVTSRLKKREKRIKAEVKMKNIEARKALKCF